MAHQHLLSTCAPVQSTCEAPVVQSTLSAEAKANYRRLSHLFVPHPADNPARKAICAVVRIELEKAGDILHVDPGNKQAREDVQVLSRHLTSLHTIENLEHEILSDEHRIGILLEDVASFRETIVELKIDLAEEEEKVAKFESRKRTREENEERGGR
jgi:hypothetical protein